MLKLNLLFHSFLLVVWSRDLTRVQNENTYSIQYPVHIQILQWLEIEVDFEYFTERGESTKRVAFREIGFCLGVLRDF